MKTTLFALLTITISQFSLSQCMSFDEDTIEVCTGVPVSFDGTPAFLLTTVQDSVDFNLGVIPNGWSVSGGVTFSQPCGPGVDNTPYFWASTSGGGVPFIESNTYNLTNGGIINFDMIYAIQGGGAPCEGPDLEDEGVSLLYSIDNGLTWVDIIYYSPGGFELPANPQTGGSVTTGPTPYTIWNNFIVTIPTAAQTPNTMLRWEQFNSSGTCCDNWGIDNIFIQFTDEVFYQWDTGATGMPLNVSSSVDTSFVVSLLDSSLNLICMDTVYLNIDNSGFDNGVQIITENFIPGQATDFVVDAYNDGCPEQSGDVVIKLGSLVSFNSSNPPPSVITADSLIYNYASLYRDGPHFTIDMNVTTDPLATTGDSVLIDALIYPVIGDINPWNNEKNYVFPVSSSSAANDKKVYPLGDCGIGYVPNDQLMTYTVRFQNTSGTQVTDVSVNDLIDANLDPSTLRLVASSHEVSLDWLGANATVNFDTILLVPQSQDPIESVGYFVFEIEQVQGLPHATSFTNEASISFDGIPQQTNQVLSTVTDGSHIVVSDTLFISAPSAYPWNGQLLTSSGLYTQAFPLPDGCDSTDILYLTLDSDVGLNSLSQNPFEIYPNPAKDHLVIKGSQAGVLRLLSASGKIILEEKIDGNNTITWGTIASGIYFVEIESQNKTYREKIVIKD